MKLKQILPVVIVLAVFSAIGIYVGATANVFPIQASAEAASVDQLFNIMLAFAVVIFLVVEVGIIYTIVRFRRHKGDETDGKPIHGNTQLEIIWTAIPAVIVVFLSVLSYRVFAENEKLFGGTENAFQVDAIAAQYQWSFAYYLPSNADPALTPEQRERIRSYMTSPLLMLPKDRLIQVNIQARDVMHAFYIPEFRIKQDAIPGAPGNPRITNAFFTPTMVGEWAVKCAELCGGGHGTMSLINRVRVVEQPEFDKWQAELYAKAVETLNNPRSPENGKRLVAEKYPCSGCHILSDGWPSQNKIGPSLNGIATRAAGYAAANEGVLGNPKDAAAYIRTAIVNPNYFVVTGYGANVMPQNYGDRSAMPEDDLEAIIAYLLTQKAS